MVVPPGDPAPPGRNRWNSMVINRILVALALVGPVSANAGPLIGAGAELSGSGRSKPVVRTASAGESRDFAQPAAHADRPATDGSFLDTSGILVVFGLRGVTVTRRSLSDGTQFPRELPTYGSHRNEDGVPRLGLAMASPRAPVAADGEDRTDQASILLRKNALAVPESVGSSSIETTAVRDKDLHGIPRQEIVNTEVYEFRRGREPPFRRWE